MYTPDLNFYGSDSFIYKISDDEGLNDTAQVFITITSANDAPVAVDDAFSTDENTPADFDVILNDYDIENDEITITSIIIGPENGSASFDLGIISYKPDNGFYGLDTLEYEIGDGNGGSDTAILFIDVIEDPINEPPNAKDDYATVVEGGRIYTLDSGESSVLENDSDPDGDILTAILTSDPSNGIVIINSDGTFSYSHDGGETVSDSFIYEASDEEGAVSSAIVFITVLPVNDPPNAHDDSITVSVNSTNNEIDVLLNDKDPEGDNLRIESIYTQPSNGTVTISNRLVFYTPDEGFIGVNIFEYNVTDDKGGIDTGKVTVKVEKGSSGIIVKPRKGYLYLLNNEFFKINKLLRFIAAETVIIGPIKIVFTITDPEFRGSRVEFYLDDELKHASDEMQCSWIFNERFFKICTIRVVAYDANDEIEVDEQTNALILNFGFSAGNGENGDGTS